MTAIALRLMTAAVMGWTRIYTCGLPRARRQRRLDEIASDLWESTHDSRVQPGRAAWHLLARLLLGLADDLTWRIEQVGRGTAMVGRIVLTAGVVALLVVWVFTNEPDSAAELPDLPELRQFEMRPRLIDPPPPPPPPCAPAGFPRDRSTSCLR